MRQPAASRRQLGVPQTPPRLVERVRRRPAADQAARPASEPCVRLPVSKTFRLTSAVKAISVHLFGALGLGRPAVRAVAEVERPVEVAAVAVVVLKGPLAQDSSWPKKQTSSQADRYDSLLILFCSTRLYVFSITVFVAGDTLTGVELLLVLWL